MLEINIPEVELYDEATKEFSNIRGRTLRLEHSLISLAKWESRWERAFLTKNAMTVEETRHYIRCMTLTQNVEDAYINRIAKFHLNEVYAYMELPMTATTIRQRKTGFAGMEVVTAELIYYWMTVFTIPFTCEKWHLNRLLTLINVCNVKNQPKKTRPLAEIYQENHDLNEKRLKEMKTSG